MWKCVCIYVRVILDRSGVETSDFDDSWTLERKKAWRTVTESVCFKSIPDIIVINIYNTIINTLWFMYLHLYYVLYVL